MAKRKKYPKLPNGYGSIKRLSGKNRTNPYGVYPPVTEFDSNGIPVNQKAICYVDDWYKGFTVLTWYKNNEYYPGREKELSSDNDKLQQQVLGILAKYNQDQRKMADQKTFADVFIEYYEKKFSAPYDHKGKKSSMEYSMRAAYKNCSSLHSIPFRTLTTNDLQEVVDTCTLKHSSLELIVTLYHQMYAYADANDLCDKDYSQYVKINSDDDDEHGIPFTDADLKKLWEHKKDEVVEMILIMCYSGFRISEYINMRTDFDWKFFQGGLKTEAGKDRIVPIHSAILSLVKNRLQNSDGYIKNVYQFRNDMYDKLNELGIERHTPHDCRHTFNYLCDKYKVNETDKKLMLGHAFSDVTNKVYLHRDLKDLQSEIEKIKVCH